jgi:hypothetical protein
MEGTSISENAKFRFCKINRIIPEINKKLLCIAARAFFPRESSHVLGKARKKIIFLILSQRQATCEELRAKNLRRELEDLKKSLKSLKKSGKMAATPWSQLP